MLFQLMMGKSMWDFPPPCSTRRSYSSSPATFLRTPLRTSCESGKYFQGLSWMWLNAKINDKHKNTLKKCTAQEILDAVFLLFLMDLTKRSSGFKMINHYHFSRLKKNGWLNVESNIFHLPLMTHLINLYFIFINTRRNLGHSVCRCFFLTPKGFQYHLHNHLHQHLLT